MYLYVLNNKLLVKSFCSKIYLKEPAKIKAQYLTSFSRVQKLPSCTIQKVSPNYLSHALSGPNVSEDTNVMLLLKRELFFVI